MKSIKLWFITFIVMIFQSSFVQAQKEYDVQLSPDQLQEDVKVLRLALENTHPGLYAYHAKEKHDAFYKGLSAKLNASMSSLDFYRNLLPVLPLIANNHTKIKCPESYDRAMSKDLPRIPLRFHVKNKRLYVRENFSDEQVMQLGDEVLSINGISSVEILKKMVSFTTLDGFNTSHTYYGIGIAFSRRYAYYFGTPDTYEIGFREKEGAIKQTVIKGIKAKIINERKNALFPVLEKINLSSKIENNIGYLKIGSFLPKSSSKFRKRIKRFFISLKDSNTEKLIIDVRGNGGGYGEAAVEVLSYLINEPIFPYKDEFALVDEIPNEEHYTKDFFFTHFKKQPLVKNGDVYQIKNITKVKIKPKKFPFKGKLIILLDGASASATGEFLGLAKSYTNAIFIGDEAGGNAVETTANDLLSLTLPNSKIRMTIPVLRTILNVNFKNTGNGVIPDYEMIPTIENILENKDVVLDFAYEKLK